MKVERQADACFVSLDVCSGQILDCADDAIEIDNSAAERALRGAANGCRSARLLALTVAASAAPSSTR